MPIAIYLLKLPEEQHELEEIQKAGSYHAAFGDLWNKLRSKVKYEDVSDEEFKVYQQVKDWIGELCQEYDLEVP